MKQLRVLCLSLALMFSLSGCCCGLFGHGGAYGAGYPGAGGGAFYGGAPGGAFFGPGATAGGCGPNGCGTPAFPSGTPAFPSGTPAFPSGASAFPSGASLYGGPTAASPGLPPGPVAFVPLQAIQTY